MAELAAARCAEVCCLDDTDAENEADDVASDADELLLVDAIADCAKASALPLLASMSALLWFVLVSVMRLIKYA